MKSFYISAMLALVSIFATFACIAADQTMPGQGNAAAQRLSGASPLVRSAVETLRDRLQSMANQEIRRNLAELIDDKRACIQHRANLSAAKRADILAKLQAEGLLKPSDGNAIQGGIEAGVFPPVALDGTECPRLPQAFYSAPGGATGSHHSHPGGLAIHEVFNDTNALALADSYQLVYGHEGQNGLPSIGKEQTAKHPNKHKSKRSNFFIDHDLVIAAPIWHDWAKILVFQWNSDGTEFTELNFGGNGVSDNVGEAGDSTTGAHHILGLAEAMKRGLPAEFVITVASAHAAPSNGGEFKVVNWLRTAAIIAQIDPVTVGYLEVDAKGHLRLPALRQLADLDLIAATGNHSYILLEYILHNLSDADFGFTVPAAGEVAQILATLAPEFGYDRNAADYAMKFHHPVLAYFSAERLYILYSNGGLEAVRQEVNKLRKLGVI